jgi:hypothetical protein
VTSVINYCALEHLRVAGVLGIATFFWSKHCDA